MRTRRGLSSVVGMVFAIIALATTIAYVSYSMNTLSQYNNAVMNQNQVLLNSGKEKFQITSVTIPKGQFNITVANTGALPINFTKIWVQNTTSATDWMYSYVPPNSFVVPGGTVTNIGQNIPLYVRSAYSYNVKLVTSRGTTQAFTVNSANTAPLNIQLFAIPSTVSSGFTTELVMTVINNGSSTLTNVAPNLPSQSAGLATCTLGPVSPPSYNTLPPGGTAIFKWDLTASTTLTPPQSCTFTLAIPLQNGYPQSVSSTVTINLVQLSSSNYAQYAGLLTINYTKFQWTQGAAWHNGWSFPSATTDFSMTIGNNNQTGGGYSLWLSQNTQLFLFQTHVPRNGKVANAAYFIVNPMPANPPTPPSFSSYSDFSVGIPNQGGITTVYFGADSPGSSNNAASLGQGTFFGFLLVYGKFTQNSGDPASGQYAQTIPVIAVVAN